MTLLGCRPLPGCQASACGQQTMLLPCLSTWSRAPLNTPSGPTGPSCGCASVGLTLQVTRPSLELLVISRALSGPTIRAPPQRGRAKAAMAQGGPWEGRWLLGWGRQPRIHPPPAQAGPLERECAKHGQLWPPGPAHHSPSYSCCGNLGSGGGRGRPKFWGFCRRWSCLGSWFPQATLVISAVTASGTEDKVRPSLSYFPFS